MNKKILFYCTTFIIVLALVVTFMYKPSVKAGSSDGNIDKPIISVTGEGVINAAPNRAKITLAVVTENADVKKAQQENNKRANAIINSIKALKIDEKDIKTQNYYINPIYNYEKNQTPRITGYRVQNEVCLTIRDIDNVGTVINAGVDAGANRVNNIYFYLEDDKIKEQALRESIKDAKKKAEIMADELGKQIVGIVKVTGEWSNIGPVPVRYKMMEEVAMDSASLYETPINPGETEVRASVQIEFEMNR